MTTSDPESCLLFEKGDGPASLGSEPVVAVANPKSDTATMRWSWFAALVCIPALWYAAMVWQYGVNIPFSDEWVALSPLFESMKAGTLGFHDFVVPHNEHRLPIPKLIFFAMGLLTHWDTRAEMWLTWLAILGMAACVWKLLGLTGGRRDASTSIVFAALGILLFSPLQDQNVLNGFQFHFVLPITLILAAFVAALTLSHPWRYIVTAALASAATFSMALGVGAWGIIFPLLFIRDLPRDWKKWTALWLGAGALNLILFSIGYHPPASDYGSMFRDPAATIRYFLIFLGSPFCFGTGLAQTDVAWWAGLALTCGLIVAVISLWRQRRDVSLLCRTIPWLMVSAIGVLDAALTTYGRLQYTFIYALQSRYVIYSAVVPIGLIVLLWILAERSMSRGASWPRPALISLGSMMFLLHGLGVVARLDSWAVLKHHKLMNKSIVQMADLVHKEQFDERTTMGPSQFRNSIHILTQLGYLNPPPLRSNSISEIGDAKSPGDPAYGKIEQASQVRDKVAMIGWAVLPERMEPANGVIITRDDAKGNPVIVDLIDNAETRADVVAKTQEPGYLRCGWIYTSALSNVSAGGVLKAWAYDAESRRAWRLAGSIALRP